MRRIPRPSRAIDPSHPLSACIRQRVSPLPCRPAPSPCTHLRTTSAAFSTTAPQSFLLPGKQDKRKHQQFVRRWQKRLLGDSEPIGAHVDPYDPTSPVRIAPEDQGEYEEVLDEEASKSPQYKPAKYLRGLPRVGGEEWLQEKVEKDLAKEFEKLTLRTYTPLTLDMANEIEELTGTPYTLKDENLLMAQTVHEKTKRPYTDYNFGLHAKATRVTDMRARFTQAVAEIYALKQADLDMDLSKFANRGVYDRPRWVKDIKLVKTETGELALAFPQHKSLDDLLETMQTAPSWETEPAESDELLVEEVVEELEDAGLAQEQVQTMDPDTPAHKRAAVVKMDGENKPFDFMSNRPVPRAKPVEAPVKEVVVEEVVVQETTPPQGAQEGLQPESLDHAADPEPVNQIAPAAASESRHAILEERAQRLAADFAALKNSVQQSSRKSSAIKPEETKWRNVPVTDINVKFALYKRLYQLTGCRISDPHLSSANTLGDLYNHLLEAAKPQPTSLFSAMHIEGQKARERAKQQATSDAEAKRRADLGDLINMGNVELRRVKPTKVEKRSKTGQDKVISYALWERGLGSGIPARLGQMKQKNRRGVKKAQPERGTVTPLTSKAASFLLKNGGSMQSAHA
ncbi:hypothetical protein J4E93_000155 [Alternaria ventricosa]|uniref:uncharacterized protein n=1 Tax=Alternaria ventricosa TaxID=1187951 RepID=UPI0020C5AACE|nr:uncharacterized protein J4E93_000155 [Alternaria ventricosa]KAI4655443.1 hypothetical protein J4E93_000155 [Alternaria ventricosa]